MLVQNASSQTFNGIHTQTSKMNSVQKKLTNKLIDGITYSDQYIKACEQGIDLCIFRNPKNANGVVVRFLDRDSESFVREKSNKKPLERAFVLSGGVEKLIAKLNDVVSGLYPIKNNVDFVDLVDNNKTDMCKLYRMLKDNEIDDGSDFIQYIRNKKSFDV